MSRDRKQASIRKPLIDEETALRFATPPTSESAATQSAETLTQPANLEKSDTVNLVLNISKETFKQITREAEKKKRSVEELLQRHLAKHYAKD
jgi:hypothetical protein